MRACKMRRISAGSFSACWSIPFSKEQPTVAIMAPGIPWPVQSAAATKQVSS